jgi:hypothetical protein
MLQKGLPRTRTLIVGAGVCTGAQRDRRAPAPSPVLSSQVDIEGVVDAPGRQRYTWNVCGRTRS